LSPDLHHILNLSFSNNHDTPKSLDSAVTMTFNTNGHLFYTYVFTHSFISSSHGNHP
jgi:hypothetical protein